MLARATPFARGYFRGTIGKKREDGALKEFGQGMGGCGRLSRASGKALKAKQPSRWEMGKW